MRHGVIVLLALLCASLSVSAQTAEELIAKNIQARGGLDKIKAIQTVRMTGRFEGSGGFKAAISQENARPNSVRETFTLQGMTAIQVFDGAVGWQIMPFGGHKDPEFMGEDDLRDMQLDGDFDGPLVDYQAKGNTVEFLGHDEVDGDDALRLKVTLKNHDVIYYYLDPDTFLEIRKEIQQTIRGSNRERIIDLGSYKQVNGVMYPFSVSQGTKANPGAQTTTMEKIEVNVPLDSSRFAVPASLKQGAKTAADAK